MISRIFSVPKVQLGAAILGMCALVTTANSACPSSSTRFVVNGAEVIDTRSNLIWQRCSAGQTWVNTACIGAVIRFTHENALVYALGNSGALGWRLPNVKELASIIDRGCQNPAVDIAAFPMPAAPEAWYWSSTPYVGSSYIAMPVEFAYGGVGGVGVLDRTLGVSVRLVRARP